MNEDKGFDGGTLLLFIAVAAGIAFLIPFLGG